MREQLDSLRETQTLPQPVATPLDCCCILIGDLSYELDEGTHTTPASSSTLQAAWYDE